VLHDYVKYKELLHIGICIQRRGSEKHCSYSTLLREVPETVRGKRTGFW
jgi:hypothetical protein